MENLIILCSASEFVWCSYDSDLWIVRKINLINILRILKGKKQHQMKLERNTSTNMDIWIIVHQINSL